MFHACLADGRRRAGIRHLGALIVSRRRLRKAGLSRSISLPGAAPERGEAEGGGTGSLSDGLLALEFVFLVGALILGPFRRRIGGPDGGSEKAIVGAMWLIAGVVIAVLVSRK